MDVTDFLTRECLVAATFLPLPMGLLVAGALLFTSQPGALRAARSALFKGAAQLLTKTVTTTLAVVEASMDPRSAIGLE